MRSILLAGVVTAALLCSACGTHSEAVSAAELRTQVPRTTIVDDRPRVLAGARDETVQGLVVPDDSRFVAPDGDDGATGSASAPWRTLGHAVEAAPDGASLVLRAGVYRESVELTRPGLTLMAFPGESVWMDGSDPVEQPVRRERDAWVIEHWDGHEPERLDPGSHLLRDDRPEAGWPDLVFVDGRPLREVADRADLGPGTFWVEVDARRLWLGEDPGSAVIDASQRGWGLYLHGADRTTLAGIGFRRFATPARLIAPLRVHADDVVVHDVRVEDNAYAGVSVMGSDNLLQQVTARRNGQLGVQARHADRLVLRRSLLVGNNIEGFDASQQAGGAKITASREVSITDAVAADNLGTGIWLDQSVVGATVARNVVARNAGSGVELELSSEIVVAGNLVATNDRNGLYVLESSEVLAAHNHVVGNLGRGVWIVEGSRSSDDASSQDHDERHPPPESLSFDVEGVRILDNVIGDLPGHNAKALLGVEDAAGARSADAMGLEVDHNAYWRAAGAPIFSTWADHPSGVVVSGDLAQHRAATRADLHSRQSTHATNPWVQGDGDAPRPAAGGPQIPTASDTGEVIDDLLELTDSSPVGVPVDLALPVAARGA